MQASNWLQPLARTAAAAAADAMNGGEDAENRHPNVQADGQAQILLELPTAVGMFVNAARVKKVSACQCRMLHTSATGYLMFANIATCKSVNHYASSVLLIAAMVQSAGGWHSGRRLCPCCGLLGGCI